MLKDAYGNPFRLYDHKGSSGTLVMFICNHCPYVRAIAGRIARDARDLQERGVSVIAVMPNDYVRYSDDAPEQMKHFAEEHGFSFPYVVDQTQEVARAYGAVCTPEFFGFNADLELQYRGRLDASRTTLVPPAASCSRRCAGSPRPATGRRSSRRAWAARSNGGSSRCGRLRPAFRASKRTLTAAARSKAPDKEIGKEWNR